MATVTQAVTIDDLREQARRRLPEFVFMPLETGAGRGESVLRNLERLREQYIVARAGMEARTPDQTTTLWGRTYASPFGISAIGSAGHFRCGGDLMMAEAAQQANLPFMLSGASNASIEQALRAVPRHVWCQLYTAREARYTDDMVRRACDAGCEVLVFTVDTPARPRNEWLARSGIGLPPRFKWRSWHYAFWQALLHPGWTLDYLLNRSSLSFGSWKAYVPGRASVGAVDRLYRSQVPGEQTWNEVQRVRKLWPGKLVIKGVLHDEDALTAIQVGADAITVSNHGGNRLPNLPAAIDVLPRVKAAVGDRVPVFFDGGIRRGSDVLVALCLGADFCFTGRAALYGLAAGGRPGVGRAIDILCSEIEHTMLMAGIARLRDAGHQWLFRSEPRANDEAA